MSSSFKEKFQKLLTEAEELVKSTPEKELKDVQIDIIKASELPAVVQNVDNIECFDDDEYNKRMLRRITGVEGVFPIILPQYDQMPAERVQKYRNHAEQVGKPFILPSIIYPTSSRDEHQFTPYILFFSHDKQLCMFPYEDEHFSDVDHDLEDHFGLSYEDSDDFFEE